MRPTVLLFQTNPQKTLSVRIFAQKLGLRVLVAAPAQLDLPLADILEQTPGEGSGEPLPGEMLVMAGLNGKITDLFLQGLRRAHAGVALNADKQRMDAPRALRRAAARTRSDGRGQDRPSAELKEEKKRWLKSISAR